MRHRGDIADRSDPEPRSLERSDSGFSTRPGTGNTNRNRRHTVFLSLVPRIFGSNLSSKWSRFLRPPESFKAGAGPGDSIAGWVGNSDYRVVETANDVSHAYRNIFLDFFPFDTFTIFYPSAAVPTFFFRVIIPLRGPFRVLALVWVLCPRTGSPRRCLNPL